MKEFKNKIRNLYPKQIYYMTWNEMCGDDSVINTGYYLGVKFYQKRVELR